MSLQGKVIAITGAASGIGLDLANVAASRGARLSLADIQQEPLDRVVAELKSANVDVIGTKVNVAVRAEVESWVKATVDHFGSLDGAANLAGIEAGKKMGGTLEEMLDEDWNLILSVNLTGLMYCVRAQLGVMKQGASIVNAASMAGLMGRPGICAYSVSKHGVVGLTKTVAKEVGSKGIRVNAVCPGPIDTPMLQRLLGKQAEEQGETPFTKTYQNIPLGRLGKSNEVAKVFAFLLSDESSFMTGLAVPCDGGLMA